MKRELRQKARDLRQEGTSVREIAKLLDVSSSSVSTWVSDIQLTDEQIARLKQNQHLWGAQNTGAQTNRANAQAKRLIYQEEGRIKAREQRPLHLTGCMLYWAEGAKDKNNINFVNSDPHMLVLFWRFLKQELHVKNTDVALYIHCHTKDTSEIARVEAYWLNLLDLPRTCLRKTLYKVGSDTRKNILENGICSLRVYSTQLVQHIYGAIQEYGGFDNPDWLF